jgi:hypothetical protein
LIQEDKEDLPLVPNLHTNIKYQLASGRGGGEERRKVARLLKMGKKGRTTMRYTKTVETGLWTAKTMKSCACSDNSSDGFKATTESDEGGSASTRQHSSSRAFIISTRVAEGKPHRYDYRKQNSI